MNLQKQLSNYFDNCHSQLVKIIFDFGSSQKKSKFAKFNSILKKGIKIIRKYSSHFRIIQSRAIQFKIATFENFHFWVETVLVKIILDIITDNITCITDELSFLWVIKLNGMILSWVNSNKSLWIKMVVDLTKRLV